MIHKTTLLLVILLASILEASFIDQSIDTLKFFQVWNGEPNLSIGGRYYDFHMNGVYFSGRRDWEGRWEAIKNATDFTNKKVLDLGSQIGICSLFISKYLPISELVSVERVDKYIEKHIQLQNVFHQEYEIIKLDLNDDLYEEQLEKDFDIVVCLSFYHWVSDKSRFLKWISLFPQVIYEGHNSYEEEVKRFKDVGFSHNKLLTYSSSAIKIREKKRPLILFSKNPIH